MLIAFLIIVFLLIAVLAIKRAWTAGESAEEKGERGEQIINSEILKCIGADDKLLANYMFQGENISVQIDHIVINKNGVYVIETKNYSGQIYGSEDQREWKQVIRTKKRYYRRRRTYTRTYTNKYTIKNPIKQNAGHIYQLSKILPKGTHFHNIVVMVQGNTQHIKAQNVISPWQLNKSLNAISNRKEINAEQINEIYEILCSKRINDKITQGQHVREINHMLADIENNICPRCKGNLVIREGKYGKFYGCSNYPKCTFKKNLE